jgi:hypothetical protein
VSGNTIWRGDEETHEARHAAQPTHGLRRGAERGRGDAEEGRGVSADAIWHGDEETHEARRAARSTHPLRRGAEWGRGEAKMGHS